VRVVLAVEVLMWQGTSCVVTGECMPGMCHVSF